MRYLLDTNIISALLRSTPDRPLLERVTAHAPGDVVTSVVVEYELRYGADRSSQPARAHRILDDLFLDVPPLPFTGNDAVVSGGVRAFLAGRGTPIGPYDVLIAGQAKARDLTLVSNNTREFARVDGLKLADWLTT